jgi:peptidoglycan/LPS O-acetylase OafA/YrhL
MDVLGGTPLGPVSLWRTDIVYDSLMTGCLLALLRRGRRASKLMDGKILGSPAILLASAAAFWVTLLPWAPTQMGLSFAPSIFNVGIALTINYVVQGKQTPLDWLLNCPPVVWIGQLSYSLYLWQQFFCHKGAGGIFWVRAFPQNLLFSFACAALSFYLIERPAAALRRRMEWVKTKPPPQGI